MREKRWSIGVAGGSFADDTTALLFDMTNVVNSADVVTYTKSKYKQEFAQELTPDIYRDRLFSIRGVDAVDRAQIDLLILNSAADDFPTNFLRSNGVIIANSDEKPLMNIIGNRGRDHTVITYGLNSKACVTVSSISDSTVVLCVQRSLPTVSGGVLEQQEFPIATISSNRDIYSVLAAGTAALVLGCVS